MQTCRVKRGTVNFRLCPPLGMIPAFHRIVERICCVLYFVVRQSLSCIWLFATPWTAAWLPCPPLLRIWNFRKCLLPAVLEWVFARRVKGGRRSLVIHVNYSVCFRHLACSCVRNWGRSRRSSPEPCCLAWSCNTTLQGAGWSRELAFNGFLL